MKSNTTAGSILNLLLVEVLMMPLRQYT